MEKNEECDKSVSIPIGQANLSLDLSTNTNANSPYIKMCKLGIVSGMIHELVVDSEDSEFKTNEELLTTERKFIPD